MPKEVVPPHVLVYDFNGRVREYHVHTRRGYFEDVETLDTKNNTGTHEYRVWRQHFARGKCDRTGLHTVKFKLSVRLMRDHIIMRPFRPWGHLLHLTSTCGKNGRIRHMSVRLYAFESGFLELG